MNNVELGKKGEDEAVALLKKSGYKVLERNVRTRIGEIDVVARDGQFLCFVEIKARTGTRFGLPEESVNRWKVRKLTLLAQIYLKFRKLPEQAIRFDVVSVLFQPDAPTQTRIIRGAFTAS